MSDRYVVDTNELAGALERWLAWWEPAHPSTYRQGGSSKGGHSHHSPAMPGISGVQHLSEATHLGIRTITRVLGRTHEFTTLNVADRLLCAIERPDLIATGAITILTRVEIRQGQAA